MKAIQRGSGGTVGSGVGGGTGVGSTEGSVGGMGVGFGAEGQAQAIARSRVTIPSPILKVDLMPNLLVNSPRLTSVARRRLTVCYQLAL
jgi:hypothetical protein